MIIPRWGGNAPDSLKISSDSQSIYTKNTRNRLKQLTKAEYIYQDRVVMHQSEN